MIKKLLLRPLTLVVFIFIILEAVFSVLPQQILGMIIDFLSGGKSNINNFVLTPFVDYISQFTVLRTISLMMALYLIISLLDLLISIGRGFFVTYAGESIIATIRRKLYSGLLRSNTAYLNTMTTGETSMRLMSDVENMRNLFIGPINGLLVDFVTVFFMIYLCFTISVSLSIIMLVPIPFVILSGFIIGNKQVTISMQIRNQISEITSTIINRIKGFMLFKLFNQEKREEEHFNRLIARYFHTVIKSLNLTLALFPLTSGLQIIIGVILLFLGVKKIEQNQLSIGELIIFLQYLNRFYRPFVSLSRYYNSVSLSLVSYRKIKQTFKDIDKYRETSEETSENLMINDLPKFRGDIKFESVGFDYKTEDERRFIIKNLSFEIHQNDKVSIFGISGSGKTTILNLIMKLHNPIKGKILIDDVNLLGIDTNVLRSKIGYLSQNNLLYNIPLIDNIRYGNPVLTDKEVVEAMIAVNLDYLTKPELLNRVHGECGDTLSGGERQRIALARLLLCNPDIILLDEPISNLDEANAKQVMDIVFKLFRDKTIVVTSHHPLALSYTSKTINI